MSNSFRSTDFRRDLPSDVKPPLREERHMWLINGDGTLIELKKEFFYFPFEVFEHYYRLTLTVGDILVQIDRVENFYALDGTVVGPEKVVLHTPDGELVINHVHILDEEGLGTHEFQDSATWCERPLTPFSSLVTWNPQEAPKR